MCRSLSVPAKQCRVAAPYSVFTLEQALEEDLKYSMCSERCHFIQDTATQGWKQSSVGITLASSMQGHGFDPQHHKEPSVLRVWSLGHFLEHILHG